MTTTSGYLGKTALESLPPGLLEERGDKRLHVGGKVRKEGWTNLNALPSPEVDHVGDVRDLSAFETASYDMVYASHVLEHLGYMKDLPAVLKELARILKPGGRLLVSVPDLETIMKLFLHKENDSRGRFQLMRMLYGGQVDAYDFHFVGLTDEFLAGFLGESGFSEVYRVPELGLFDDTSKLKFRGVFISLNMVAVR